MNALIVSAANDTNGQNARFVRAAERFGDDPDVLRILVLGKTDPAGVVGRYQEAASRHGRLSIRSAHKASPYMDFPVDIVWSSKTHSLVRSLARQADLLHLNNSWRAYRALGMKKPALLHHHGSLFRNDPVGMMRTARQFRMTQAVSTLDLTRPAPDILHWLPAAYDLGAIAAMRQKRDDGMVRIVSAPTNRAYKSTAALEVAVALLASEGLPVELDLVERRTWAETMQRKAQADILFDQVAAPGALRSGGDYPGGYGCNAIEAWALGLPVVAGADEWTTARMRQEFGSLPFVEASVTTIADALRRLVKSADMRAEWGERGLAHVRRYHAEKPALARLAELYHMTMRDYSDRSRYKVEPVTFVNNKQRVVYDADGAKVEWQDGRITTDDALLIERLRGYKHRRLFGIVEVEA